jgi:hypothetical protein
MDGATSDPKAEGGGKRFRNRRKFARRMTRPACVRIRSCTKTLCDEGQQKINIPFFIFFVFLISNFRFRVRVVVWFEP